MKKVLWCVYTPKSKNFKISKPVPVLKKNEHVRVVNAYADTRFSNLATSNHTVDHNHVGGAANAGRASSVMLLEYSSSPSSGTSWPPGSTGWGDSYSLPNAITKTKKYFFFHKMFLYILIVYFTVVYFLSM